MAHIAVIIIARNEAGSIARCLSSAASITDTIIFLDTGSTDDTVEIAKSLGVAPHFFKWCDDFSAARNAALDLSPAAWNLMLDADEWLDGDRQTLHDMIDTSPVPFLGLLPVHSAYDLQGQTGNATSWIPRLLPSGVRYEGRVHEQPVSLLPRKRCALPIYHDGYLLAKLQAKAGRNLALLTLALDEAPNDPYLLYQIGKDAQIYRDYGHAFDYYLLAIGRVDLTAGFRHDIVIRAIFAGMKASRHEEAITLAEGEFANWQESPDFFFALGDLFLDWALLNPAQAESQFLPLVESSWLKCLELGEKPDLEGAVAGRGSYLAAHNLACFYDGTGQPDRAARFRTLARHKE